MEKFIPYEKLSKKEKRKIDAAKRSTWGEMNPVTRKPLNSKAYNRNKARNWKREQHETNSGSVFISVFFPNQVCFIGLVDQDISTVMSDTLFQIGFVFCNQLRC